MIESVFSDRILEQHVSAIFQTCRRHTKTEDAAWDACQDTFLAFSKRRDSLDTSRDLRPWLQETARRCSLAVSRKERKQPTPINLDEPLTEHDYAEAAFLNDAAIALREEVASMPAAEQKLLRLVYVECLTHRDAARKLGYPAGSVHAKAEQARERLRRRLERRGISLGLLLLLFLLQGETQASCVPFKAHKSAASHAIGLKWQTVVLMILTALTLILQGDYYRRSRLLADVPVIGIPTGPTHVCSDEGIVFSEPDESSHTWQE